MPSDVGELFVRVRPDTAGFQEEASPGIAGAGTSLAKLFIAAFAAVGVGDVIKHTVEAAVKQQQAYQQVATAVKDVGAQHEVAGKSIDALIGKQADVSGFSTTDLAAGFVPLVAATKNSAESFRLLGDAENLARARNISVTVAANDYAKAIEGQTGALARYVPGIVPVTAAVQNLHDKWAGLADLGVTLTASQKAQEAEGLKLATIQDKLATGAELVAASQARFGGESAAYAKTAAGEWDIFRVSVENLEVAIGNQLLPVLDSGAETLGRWADELARSKSVQDDAAAAGHDLATAFKDVEAVGAVVGPLLLDIATAAKDVVDAVGAPTILVAVAAYKALGLATAGAAAAEGLYARAVAAGASVTVAASASTTAAVGRESASLGMLASSYAVVDKEAEAFSALSAAQAGELAALIGQFEAYSIAVDEAAASTAALATADAALASSEAGAGIGEFLSGIGSLGLAAAGGPVGLAVIGIAGLAAVIYKLSTQENGWERANDAAKGSVQGLTAALQQQQSAVGKLQQEAAAANVEAARRKAIADVEAQGAASTTYTLPAAHTLGPGSIVPGATAANLVLQDQAIVRERLSLQTGKNTEAEKLFIKSLQDDAEALGTTNPLLNHNLNLIAQLAEELGKVPSEVDIQLLINNKDPQASLVGILSGLDAINAALEGAVQAGARSAIAAGGPLQGGSAIIQDLKTGKSHAILTEAARLSIDQLAQGIQTATDEQANLKAQMVDAVQQGAIAVAAAVQQAKQNFNTIGQDLVTSISAYLTEPLTVATNAYQAAADRLTLTQQEVTTKFVGENARLAASNNAISLRNAELALREERGGIALPGGRTLSTNNAEAIRQLEALLRHTTSPAGKAALQQYIDQYQTDINAVTSALIAKRSEQSPVNAQRAANVALRQEFLRNSQDQITIEEETAKTSLANWTQEWIDKKITLQRFNEDVHGLITRDVGRLGNVARVPGGYALEQALRGDLTGLSRQALALAQGPQQAGSGLVPSIVHPLTTLQQETKQIASIAQQQRTTANTILTDQRNLLKQIYSAEKNVGALSSLAKNPPTRAQTRAALAGVGIG